MSRSVSALFLREMSTTYGRSPGGYLWAVLEPLGGILLLAIGFSLVIHRPPLGTSFLLFYASGLMPFMLYQAVSTSVARSVSFSKSLLSYPTVSWLDAIIARLLLNSITSLVVTFITIVVILGIVGEQVSLDFPPILAALALAILLGTGVGVMNCFLIGMFPVWALIWSILTRPLFIASGIILLYENLSKTTQDILWYNPLIHITSIMRTAFYPTYHPQYIDIKYVVFTSLFLLAAGLFCMRLWGHKVLQR